MLDFINNCTFQDVADFVIYKHEGKFFTHDILKQNAIIYCSTNDLDELFNNLRFSGRKYILITHISDYPIDATRFSRKPPCIKKWFAENASFVHPDIITIPIGLTPHKGAAKTILDLEWFIENIEALIVKPKDYKLYCNWNKDNNKRQRNGILEKLKANKVEYIWDYPDFPPSIHQDIQEKIKLKERGEITKQDLNNFIKYYDYCKHMSEHQFVVSPPGNGEDCHRTWEALYMGCFPIVLKSNIFREYENELPIIQVNNYSEVTYDLLYPYLDKEYKYEKLYMSYWKERIKEEFNKL